MSQETRKDPRAKVLSMTVRYKSATLDEFIEHHSYDVSRGGMYIKTPRPFPPGTLLKFEVRIAENQRVMQGVGRVVWKRNPTEADDGHPAGMGVKFIKLDDDSKALIDQLVVRRRDEDSEFERGDETTPAAGVAALRAKAVERTKAEPRTSIPVVDTGRDGQSADAPFFPRAEPDVGAPPREDRTMLKQAAELLQDALREAGGSVEELGTNPERPATTAGEEGPAGARPRPSGGPRGSSTGPSSDPAMLRRQRRESDGRAVAGAPDSPREGRASAPLAAKTDHAREQPIAAGASESESRGGGATKLVLLTVGVAAAVVLVFYVTREREPDAPTKAESSVAAEAPAIQPIVVPSVAPSAAIVSVDAGTAADGAGADPDSAAQGIDSGTRGLKPVPALVAPTTRPAPAPLKRPKRSPAPAATSAGEATAPEDPAVPGEPAPQATSITPAASAPGVATPALPSGSSVPNAPSSAPVAPPGPRASPASPPSGPPPSSPPSSDNPYE